MSELLKYTMFKDRQHNKFCDTTEGKLAVRTCAEVTNTTDNPVPVFPQLPGENYQVDFQGVTNPGIALTILDTTLPLGKKLRLTRLDVTCRMEGVFKVTAGAKVIATGRTNASNVNAKFDWLAQREVASGIQVKIVFTASTWRPPSDIEAYFHGRLIDA